MSVTVLEESSEGDATAVKKRLEAVGAFPVLAMTSRVESLAIEYIESGIVPASSAGDAFRLSFATVYELDMLVTWNFKHLANAFIQKRLRDYNQREGLQTPVICTPEELLGE